MGIAASPRTNKRGTLPLLALLPLIASLNIFGQTILETQPETQLEQTRHKGWWPNNGSAPRSAYTGSQACARCHAAEFAGWQASEMANALKPAAQSEFLRAHPHLSFDWGRFKYRIDLDKDEAIYSITDGTSTLSLPLLWAYGVGVVGQAFVFRDQGTYFEAEVAYYPQLNGLDVVAGVPRAAPATLQAAFGIPLVPMAAQQCISCHTTAAVVSGRLQVESAILGVGCEACHGPGARHVAVMKAKSNSNSPATSSTSSSGRAPKGRG
ncbi:MAG TPA: multiheme c-type cytochrome [Terriglobia bacterium]|nr:multiheme c-type cytochrome [Terriglobia bacterium]